jgi:hypothetical protein
MVIRGKSVRIYVFGLSVGAENIILSAPKSCIGNLWKIRSWWDLKATATLKL